MVCTKKNWLIVCRICCRIKTAQFFAHMSLQTSLPSSIQPLLAICPCYIPERSILFLDLSTFLCVFYITNNVYHFKEQLHSPIKYLHTCIYLYSCILYLLFYLLIFLYFLYMGKLVYKTKGNSAPLPLLQRVLMRFSIYIYFLFFAKVWWSRWPLMTAICGPLVVTGPISPVHSSPVKPVETSWTRLFRFRIFSWTVIGIFCVMYICIF